MTLTFYQNASDPRAVTKDLTSLGAIENCVMRDGLNELNPVFRVATEALPQSFNYCYCDWTKRFYFTKSPIWLRTGLVDVPCTVDVLSSFAEQIRGLTATVERNENRANAYLIDDRYKAYSYQQIVTKQFPNQMADDSIILMTVG